MRREELDAEIAAGVVFWGCEVDGELVGVMGVQPVRDVDLIRHAYVAPASQGRGLGGALLDHLLRGSTRRTLVGTWAAAEWAIRFYQGHGFAPVDSKRAAALLQAYWTIPARQVETSVVLAWPPLAGNGAGGRDALPETRWALAIRAATALRHVGESAGRLFGDRLIARRATSADARRAGGMRPRVMVCLLLIAIASVATASSVAAAPRLSGPSAMSVLQKVTFKATGLRDGCGRVPGALDERVHLTRLVVSGAQDASRSHPPRR